MGAHSILKCEQNNSKVREIINMHLIHSGVQKLPSLPVKLKQMVLQSYLTKGNGKVIPYDCETSSSYIF
jgi:hypothetical protein